MIKPIKKAVIPAAGLGTRFLPATASLPKEMLPIVDKPMIQYAVEEAIEAGIEQFIIITGRGKQTIENHFDRAYELEKTLVERGKRVALEILEKQRPKPGQVSFTRQQVPMGLGHAVWCARAFIHDEPFAVLLPDDLLLAPQKSVMKQMVEAYQNTGGMMCAIADVPREETYKYGILDVKEQQGKIITAKGIVEKPNPSDAPSTMSVVGRYILHSDIFKDLALMEKGAGGEVQLTDSIQNIMDAYSLYGYLYEGKRFDCGSPEGFLKANIGFARQDPELYKVIQEEILEEV